MLRLERVLKSEPVVHEEKVLAYPDKSKYGDSELAQNDGVKELGDAGLQLRRTPSAITLERAVETQGLRCKCGPEVFFLLRR
jgi:hypothetical protein